MARVLKTRENLPEKKSSKLVFTVGGTDYDSKKENFDRLLGELEVLLESGAKIPGSASKTKTKSASASQESISSRHDAAAAAGVTRGGGSAASTLIRPKPRGNDSKRFGVSAPSGAERFSNQNCLKLSRSTFERNSIPKMFKPIRDEPQHRSPEGGMEMEMEANVGGQENLDDNGGGSTKTDETERPEGKDSSSKALKPKRRKSLPSCCEKTQELAESISAADARISETYDISYYSSEVKEPTKSDCYSSLSERDAAVIGSSGTERVTLGRGLGVKSVSDECVYDKRDAYAETTTTSGIFSDRSAEKSMDFYLYSTSPWQFNRRISVTEPSSPAKEGEGFVDYSPSIPSPGSTDETARTSAVQGLESDVSDTESESAVARVKKSSSFLVPRNVNVSVDSTQTKKPRGNKSKVRKPSASSTSSYDSYCRSRSFNKEFSKAAEPDKHGTPSGASRGVSSRSRSSSRRKSENVKLLHHQRGLWDPDAASKTSDEGEGPRKYGKFSTVDRLTRVKPGARKSFADQPEPSPTEFRPENLVIGPRAKSWNRETDKKKFGMLQPSEIDPDVYFYLLEILTRKSLGVGGGHGTPEIWTKSLPRNHKSRWQKHTEKSNSDISRRLNDAIKCEKDCLEILHSISKEKGEFCTRPKSKPAADHKVPLSEMTMTGTGNLTTGKMTTDSTSKSRQRCSEREAYTPPLPRTFLIETGAPNLKSSIFREDSCFSSKKNSASREKLASCNKTKEGCVLKIEDGNLWIEICKAIQETEAKNKKFKKSVYQT